MLISKYIGALFMLAGALFGGLSHSRGELMGARVLLGVGTAFARMCFADHKYFHVANRSRNHRLCFSPRAGSSSSKAHGWRISKYDLFRAYTHLSLAP